MLACLLHLCGHRARDREATPTHSPVSVIQQPHHGRLAELVRACCPSITHCVHKGAASKQASNQSIYKLRPRPLSTYARARTAQPSSSLAMHARSLQAFTCKLRLRDSRGVPAAVGGWVGGGGCRGYSLSLALSLSIRRIGWFSVRPSALPSWIHEMKPVWNEWPG